MTPQERDLIVDLFGRLRSADTSAKDREADELIGRLTAEHQGAPYLLVQTVLIQNQALTAAQTQMQELQRQLAQAQAAAKPSGSGSFLGGGGGLFGAFGRRPAAEPPMAAPPPPPPPPQPGPWGAPQPSPWGAPRAGGGFLQTAMATAAGVAGGALLFEGIEHLMGGNTGAFGQTASAPIENTTVNNYYGDQGGGGAQSYDTSYDSSYDSSSGGSDGGSFYDDV
jgi:uncharacterized protein